MLKQTPNIHWVKSSIKIYRTFILDNYFFKSLVSSSFGFMKKKNQKSGAKKKNWCKIRGNLYNLFFNKFSKKPPVNGFGHNRIET